MLRMAQEVPTRRRFGRFESVRRLRLKRLLGRGDLQLSADLPPQHGDRLAAAIEEAVKLREPTARRAAAARVVGAYTGLDQSGQRRFFELLATRFGADDGALADAIGAFTAATDAASRAQAERALRAAVVPRYADFVHVVTGLPGGVKLLVDLRADLIAFRHSDPTLALVDDELVGHLSTLFDVGLLELRRITWESSSAALLERLIAYEAVHEIEGWDDLKHRLDSDRRCFAFLHPAMPDEPLVFVEIALTKGLAGNLPHLLDQEVPATDPADADTAIFYSITNCQPGLAGVNLGNELIKRVVQTLRGELPNLGAFATLSPMPGFRQWAEQAFADDLLTPGEREAFGAPPATVADQLADPRWTSDPAEADRFRAGLLSMAARYVSTPVDGRAADPVGNFHLSNGSRVEKLNWLANPAPYELRRSYGLMVNYRYEPSDIEENVERYLADGVIATTSQIRNLVLNKSKG
jgi:malonyl-CoA decarboxylase